MAQDTSATDKQDDNLKATNSKSSRSIRAHKTTKRNGKRTPGRKVSRFQSNSKKPSKKVNQSAQAKYPRDSVNNALRIPRAILEQNAGKECSDSEAVGYLGFKLSGELRQEISSAIKYGFLERPSAGKLKVSELARKILRPQQPKDAIEGLRDAVLKAPGLSDVYMHYRGENLPDDLFFENAIVDTFHIPEAKVSEFKSIFLETLQSANLLERHNDRWRVIDVSKEDSFDGSHALKALGKSVVIGSNDSCFVIMPFALPLGNHYELIFEPAIQKAGLKAVRADADIFATGKIMDQVWRGITAAKVLIAELTSRNPNVFYELGIAHALEKPVVLVSSNEEDVPFDVRHIRVIYYDINDPFWGEKLTAKVSENILSALKNPEEAIFKSLSD